MGWVAKAKDQVQGGVLSYEEFVVSPCGQVVIVEDTFALSGWTMIMTHK